MTRFISNCAAVAVLLLFASCSGDSPPESPVPRNVETYQVTLDPAMRRTIYPGQLRAVDRSDIGFETGGIITSLAVDLGDRFEAGAILGRVDGTQQKLAIDARQSDILDAEAQRSDAEIDYTRRNALRGTGAMSEAAIDAAEARLSSAEARVEGLKSALAQARKSLADTRMVAPFSGEVIERLVEPSQIVSPGQPVLRIISLEGGLEGVIAVPEAALSTFPEGSEVRITAQPGNRTFTARVTETGSSPNAAGLYPVVLALGTSEGLRPGLRIEAQSSTPSGAASERLTIPLTAFLPRGDGDAIVFMIAEDGRSVDARNVELGALTDQGAVVRSGLREGDTIVAKGLAVLRDGEEVAPLDTGPRRFNP